MPSFSAQKGLHNVSLDPLIGEEENSQLDFQEKKQFQVYTYRWVVLACFIFAAVANAVVLLTWAPISDKAQTYWNDINITAVNLLSVTFQICYVPGTLLALRFSERHSLRGLLLRGGMLTSIGCIIRTLGALLREPLGPEFSYAIILIGTIFVGLAQPFYLNMPAKIATTWFGLAERDIATTLCSLGNPLGSAIGSILPAMFVFSESENSIEDQVRNLLITQMIIALLALLISYIFLKSRPITPASTTAEQMQIIQSTKELNTIFDEIPKLFRHREYVKLLFSFSIVLGNLNAIASLLNQLPGGYSNGEIGFTGAILIMSGFVGAFLTGFLLDFSKSYEKILKSSYVLTFLTWLFFFSNCRKNNFPLFIISAALLGGATLPTIPSTIVSSVECSYPVPEDASVGLLYMSANLTAIAMTFIGQVMLGLNSFGPAPLFPYAIWVLCFLFSSLIPILLFQGQYFRLEQDS